MSPAETTFFGHDAPYRKAFTYLGLAANTAHMEGETNIDLKKLSLAQLVSRLSLGSWIFLFGLVVSTFGVGVFWGATQTSESRTILEKNDRILELENRLNQEIEAHALLRRRYEEVTREIVLEIDTMPVPSIDAERFERSRQDLENLLDEVLKE